MKEPSAVSTQQSASMLYPERTRGNPVTTKDTKEHEGAFGWIPGWSRSLVAAIAFSAFCITLLGCGYHTAGHASRLPQTLHVIAVPGFTNQTQTYRIEQLLTQEVVREFISRTNYQVVNSVSSSADATLKGVVVSTLAAPLTYDAQTGRVSSAVVTVTMHVSLVDRSGKMLFENSNYTFREQYQVSREIASFFNEETPALQRMSRDFARTLVSDILEAY